MLNIDQDPHRRLNALTGEWVLVSPHRTARPWQGMVESSANASEPTYDPKCYLCPGNERAGGVRNPKYTSTFVFDNDFAALKPGVPAEIRNENRNSLLRAEGEPGICRVVCFSPRHDLTLASMPAAEIEGVVGVWAEQTRELGALDSIGYVQIFENRGAMMGASNPHPHCQVWATAHIPNEPAKEQRTQAAYRAEHSSCLICDYARIEEDGERVVFSTDEYLVVVPFWAVWPFETMVIPRAHVGGLPQLNAKRSRGLAAVLQRITSLYDSVFNAPFPYSMGFHQAPTDGTDHPEWHLHAHFYPPLLRSASIRKFMVGFEMLGTPQRDITPENAASRLRELAARA
jgi:UDPglucose--hexose-1-phosphate uridylyltransferase